MESNVLFIALQDEDEFEEQVRQKQNEFLDVYSLYKRTGLRWIKEELILKAYQLHLLNPNFKFHI